MKNCGALPMQGFLTFPCPGCGKNLKVRSEMCGIKVACGHCRRHLLAPSPARLLPRPTSDSTAPNAATLKTSPVDLEFCAWRVWAAEVRDGKGSHQKIQECDAELARALTNLMDTWETLSKRAARPDAGSNVVAGLESNIQSIIGILLAHGIAPPRKPAATSSAASNSQ